jgi:hypothetical protein
MRLRKWVTKLAMWDSAIEILFIVVVVIIVIIMSLG